MPAQLRVFLKNKQMFEIAKSSYEGFYTQPMSWAKAEEKFHLLTSTELDAQQRQSLIQAIHHLDQIQVRDFTSLLQSMNFVQVPKVA